MTLCGRFLVFVVVIFIFVVDPGVIPTGAVAGKSQHVEDDAADFFRNADPGPAGKKRQSRAPDAEQRNSSAAAVQHRLQGGTQQAADHATRGKIPDVIGINRRQTAGGENQRQRANQTQRDGKVIDVIIVLAMTPGKPAATNNDDREGVGHHAKDKEQRICQPCARYTA